MSPWITRRVLKLFVQVTLLLFMKSGNRPCKMLFTVRWKKGGMIDAGTHAAETLEEMGVPNWVIDKGLCPGLPSWEALKDCHENFATPDSGGKGRWLEGPQSWHGDVMPNRIKGLGLDDKWVVKFAGAADALWAELKAAEKEGRGTIIFNWTPNFTDASGFTFIEFPPYYDGCRMADGGDLSTTGCGSPIGWLKKGVNYRFPRSHPKAYTLPSQNCLSLPRRSVRWLRSSMLTA